MKNARLIWKPKAMNAAIAMACANGFLVSPALAVGYCGVNAGSLPVVDTSMTQQCQLPSDSSSIDATINTGVKIEVSTNTAAVYYSGNLGNSENSQGSLTNNGTISSTGNGSSAPSDVNVGVRISGNLIGTLTNNHLISGTSTNNAGSAFALGVGVGNIFTTRQMLGTMVNNGAISATATGSGSGYAIAYFVTDAVAPEASITNNVNGSITATMNASGGYAAGISANTFNGTLNNAGTISGTVLNGGVAYSLLLSSGSDGLVNNLATGVLSGSLMTGSGITVNNAGTLDLPLTLNAGPATGFIGGNYDQTETGVLKIAALSADPAGYSQLTVGGNATIAGKAFVDVKTANTLAVGQTLQGVVTAGTLSGNFASVADNSSLFNFISVVNGSHIDFQIIKGMTVTEAITSQSNNPAAGAAGVLDSLIAAGSTGNAGMDAIVTTLGQLTTQQQVSNAVSQTLPLLPGGQAVAVSGSLHSVNRIVQARQEGQHGRSSGDEFLGNKQAWVKPFGSAADQDDKSGVSGYKARTSG
ncbi:MAG: hypothetical protein V4713_16920, partial [Pseudomonadota bacterium]